MKLLDLQEKRANTSTVHMAYFMEGAMPTQAQLDAMEIMDVMNNCLHMRPYFHGLYSTGGRTIMQPVSRYASVKNWTLYASWQEVDTVYGKQVLPKTKCRRLRDLNADSATPFMQVNNIFAMIAMHRVTEPQSTANLLASANGLMTVDLDPTDATKTIVAEYDFGADVEISGYMKINGASGAAVNAGYNVTLQAKLNDVWTDVSALTGVNSTDGNDPVMYPITYTGNKVTARYFRLRRTQTATQVYPCGIRFFGKYVAGAPRTFGKIGYVIMVPWSRAATDLNTNGLDTQGACNIMLGSQVSAMDDRQVAMSAYSVTDDPKQIANFDLFLPNGLDYEQGTDLYPPFFTTIPPVVELEAL